MSHYRKVQTSIWLDAKFAALSDDGKFLFMLLLTHPQMTSLGAMRATPAGLAADLDWRPSRVGRALQQCLASGMVEHDEVGRLIALPNFLRFNRPESPNVVRSWARGYADLPESHLKSLTLSRAQASAEGMGEAFAKAFRQAFADVFAKSMPNHKQKQKHTNPSQGVTGLKGGEASQESAGRSLRIVPPSGRGSG